MAKPPPSSPNRLLTGTRTFSKVNSQCPSFCYRVRVTNCGQEDLRNVTVVDNKLNLSSCNFTNYLKVGQTVECILAGVPHCNNVTNTVTATTGPARTSPNTSPTADVASVPTIAT